MSSKQKSLYMDQIMMKSRSNKQPKVTLPKLDPDAMNQKPQLSPMNKIDIQLSPIFSKASLQQQQTQYYSSHNHPLRQNSGKHNKSFKNYIQLAQPTSIVPPDLQEIQQSENTQIGSLESHKQNPFLLSPQPHIPLSPTDFNPTQGFIDDQPLRFSRQQSTNNFNNIFVGNYSKIKRDNSNTSQEVTFQRQQSFGEQPMLAPQKQQSESNPRSSSSSQFNFCNQCHQEYLRRLNQDEMIKLKELEAIKREKDYILKNVVANMHQDNYAQQQQQEMLFYCNRIDNPSQYRKIGKLHLHERFLKIKKFKEKKQRRIWKKKIFYDCRKQVADKRLRIKGRFIRKDDQKKLLMDIFGNGELFPQDVKQFNSTLTQLMSEYQKQKLKRNMMDAHDFIYEKQDEKGVRHRFFDFKKFSNFIEDESDHKLNEEFSQGVLQQSNESNERQGEPLQQIQPMIKGGGKQKQKEENKSQIREERSNGKVERQVMKVERQGIKEERHSIEIKDKKRRDEKDDNHKRMKKLRDKEKKKGKQEIVTKSKM